VSDAELLLRHLEVALRRHAAELRRDGRPVPSCVVSAVTTVASLRHIATRLDPNADAADAGGMASLLLAKRDAGRLLAVSERTVERLIAAGTLPAVRLSDGATRVRRTDLESYADGLPAVGREVAG